MKTYREATDDFFGKLQYPNNVDFIHELETLLSSTSELQEQLKNAQARYKTDSLDAYRKGYYIYDAWNYIRDLMNLCELNNIN